MSFKDVKRDYIISSAKKLFLERSISEITIRDISIESEIGEATVYRYFSTKQNLAVAVAIKIQKEIASSFAKEIPGLCGYELIKNYYDMFLNVYKEHPEYYRFISEFDSMYLNVVDSNEYSDGLDEFKAFFMHGYQKGLVDHTIKANKQIELFYYTTSHALLELCKKLSFSSNLRQDKESNKESEIEMLISLFVKGLHC